MATKFNWFGIPSLFRFLGETIKKDSPESSKRAIGWMFSVAIVAELFVNTNADIEKLVLYILCGLIMLLFGLATFEQIKGK